VFIGFVKVHAQNKQLTLYIICIFWVISITLVAEKNEEKTEKYPVDEGAHNHKEIWEFVSCIIK